MCVHRSILRGYSSLGTAITFMYSKRLSRANADTRERRHIGIGELVNFFHLLERPKNSRFTDAPNFFESSFWKDSDPHSGLGGWGDPNADFSVRDGGFRDLRLSYPSPHNVRRNFTLQPFVDVIPSLTEFIEDPLLLANTSITAAAVEKVLDTPAPGDFKGFQKALETFQVRRRTDRLRVFLICVCHKSGCTFQRTRDYGRV